MLQPQDSRSRRPGDAAGAVAARRRLHDKGLTEPLAEAVGQVLEAARAVDRDSVLDAGCGDGFYLGSLSQRFGFEGHGVDISIPAVDAAARRYPGCEWVVANADRFLPWPEASFSRVMSITARMNAPEFRRVMRDDGRLLVAIPSPEDLLELRGTGKDRVDRTVETFADHFNVVSQSRVTTIASLDAASVADVLLSIYRPMQAEPPGAMSVTFSLDLLLFEVS